MSGMRIASAIGTLHISVTDAYDFIANIAYIHHIGKNDVTLRCVNICAMVELIFQKEAEEQDRSMAAISAIVDECLLCNPRIHGSLAHTGN